MARKYIQQKAQDNTQLFNSLVINAIDFLESAIDDLDQRPKNSIVDFYTAIELFLKARLMLEHWTLILDEPGNAKFQSFSIGDFKSIYFDDAVKRLKHILNIKFDDETLLNFKTLGEHRNQIVHFAHTEYSNSQASKAGVVAQQWSSWHYLYQLLSKDWGQQFVDYQDKLQEIHRRMLEQKEFLNTRFNELSQQFEILNKKNIKIVSCKQCGLKSGEVKQAHDWGDDYECLVCESHGVALKPITDTLDCPQCKTPFSFFDAELTNCPHCNFNIDTNLLIRLCREKYNLGDGYQEGEYIAGCHECKHTPNSVFYIEGQWSCVSCFDRGWTAINCPHCDEFVTGDMDKIKYFACYKCEEVQSRFILSKY